MNNDNNSKIVENNIVESNVDTIETIIDYTKKISSTQKGRKKIKRGN